jgi:hypothetical protein
MAMPGRLPTAGRAGPACGAARLLRMSQAERDALFARGDPGPIPDGACRGIVIVAPGTALAVGAAALVSLFAWRGKVFNAAAGWVSNRILPFGLRAVTAKVYEGTSRLDGRACIVLDYSETSLVARRVRDEVRLLRPGLYLGKAYWGGVRLIGFALEF